MKRTSRVFSRAALRLALLLLLLPLVGCETKKVTVQIPGFGTGNVAGIWLWRYTPATGQYVRACRIELSRTQSAADGSEKLPYFQVCADPGQIGFNLEAKVERLGTDPTTIVVSLWYLRYTDPGQYKASAYNAAGESGLSPTALAL